MIIINGDNNNNDNDGSISVTCIGIVFKQDAECALCGLLHGFSFPRF